MKQSATLDSSFWINSHRAGLVSHVLDRFDLTFAPAVAEELSEELASGREFWRLVSRRVLHQEAPLEDRVKEFGPGERAAMNLALEHPDWFLLVDDRRPLQAAQRLGIRTVCTPVLAVDLASEGNLSLDEALEVLGRLQAMQTVSPVLIAVALTQLQEVRQRREL